MSSHTYGNKKTSSPTRTPLNATANSNSQRCLARNSAAAFWRNGQIVANPRSNGGRRNQPPRTRKKTKPNATLGHRSRRNEETLFGLVVINNVVALAKIQPPKYRVATRYLGLIRTLMRINSTRWLFLFRHRFGRTSHPCTNTMARSAKRQLRHSEAMADSNTPGDAAHHQISRGVPQRSKATLFTCA